ncbi:glycosyltransferase, partial [Escherichia coli]
LPDDTRLWPTVDVYVPTYNESLDVVRDTVLAAQCIDYPRDKIKVYLLDDGKRSEFAVFAADVGVGYITRDDNRHAKAGNLNHAMTITKGEL